MHFLKLINNKGRQQHWLKSHRYAPEVILKELIKEIKEIN
jgi:hypothetical protein